MTHAYLIAIVDPKYVDVVDKIEEMMLPYDEKMQVSPYIDQCSGCEGKGCKYCKDTGKVTSTYNLKSEWDWYIFGGSWWGGITGKQDDGKDHNHDQIDQLLEDNRTIVSKLSRAETDIPYALLLPDGTWMSREVWNRRTHKWERKTDEEWMEIVTTEYNRYANYTAVGIDYHI